MPTIIPSAYKNNQQKDGYGIKCYNAIRAKITTFFIY